MYESIEICHSDTAVTLALGNAGAECVNHLVEAGADVNIKDRNGFRPLHFAAEKYNRCLQMFISAGADVNAQSMNGYKAVMEAPLE